MRFIAIALLLTSCANTGTYTAFSASAMAGKVAVDEFKVWDHDHKRALIAAHPECSSAPSPDACREAAIAPYVAKREPVLALADATRAAILVAEEASKMASDGGVALAATIAEQSAKLLAAYAALRKGTP